MREFALSSGNFIEVWEWEQLLRFRELTGGKRLTIHSFLLNYSTVNMPDWELKKQLQKFVKEFKIKKLRVNADNFFDIDVIPQDLESFEIFYTMQKENAEKILSRPIEQLKFPNVVLECYGNVEFKYLAKMVIATKTLVLTIGNSLDFSVVVDYFNDYPDLNKIEELRVNVYQSNTEQMTIDQLKWF